MSFLVFNSRFHPAPRARRYALGAAITAGVFLLAIVVPKLSAQQSPEKIEEINKQFHFLGPDDTVLIHEEDGKLKGQINVYPGEEESDEILNYDFTIGTRKGDLVELKTAKVHERYYRFMGAVERGTGRKEKDPDYLRLVGNLEIVTVNGMTGKETTESRRVIFKSFGADEIPD
ncbi:MAG TPA: hypothetical protein VFM21_03785 [Terriglobia bacterium]|nr:hypothetical protein [Terriglobia bacterium]